MVRLAAWTLAAAIMLMLVAGGVHYWRTRQLRNALYAALTPVRITNCRLNRYGNANDGGYLMCANLMAGAQSGYSYGIGGEDAWGCDVTGQTGVPIHQYDCFNTQAPACPGASTIFHAECVGADRGTIDNRPFNTIGNHVAENGDTGKRLIMKMDVEGAEWRSLAVAPDHVLEAIDQLAVEFHRVERTHFLDTITRLNDFFYVAHIHYNNYECRPGYDPFPAPVFEVLFVSKRIAVANPWVDARGPSPLDAPNTRALPDCQVSAVGAEPQRIGRWIYRYANAAFRLLRAPLQK